MPKDNKEYDPYSTSSGEIGSHHKSKTKQEVKGGEGNLADLMNGRSGRRWDGLSSRDQAHLLRGNSVGTSNVFVKQKDIRAVDEKQPPLPQARPSTAPKRPEGSSFARFVNGESGPSWSHSENLTFRDQANLSRGNPVGTSAVFDKRKDQYNSARTADAETSRQPSTSVKGKSAKPVFLNFHSR